MTTRELLSSAWDTGPLVPSLSAVLLAGYVIHFRRRRSARALFFALAVCVFYLALASPVGVLARGYLFSAHMLQHLALVLAVPPLVLLGLPRERDLARPHEASPLVHARSWIAGVGAMWIWHAQPLCDAAAVNPAVQWAQTASLVAMGLAFWHPILAPRRSDRLAPLAAVVYLFAACVACTVLGILVTLAPVTVCSAYEHPVDALGVMPLLQSEWGLTHRVNQQIGGLLMWVPTCLVYAGAILAELGRYYGEEHRGVAVEGAR